MYESPLDGWGGCSEEFLGHMHTLSHQSMDQSARVMPNIQEAEALIPLLKGFASLVIQAAPNHALALVFIGEVNLSKRQKQRLSIARALIKSPDMLILDEPTTAWTASSNARSSLSCCA